MSFNGAIIRPTVTVNVAAGVPTVPSWPLPVLDTFGFWSVANPGRFTIPAGVEIIRLDANAVALASTTQRIFVRFVHNGVFRGAYTNYGAAGTAGANTSSGPMVVNAGDFVELSVFLQLTAQLAGTGDTYFSLTVLQTS